MYHFSSLLLTIPSNQNLNTEHLTGLRQTLPQSSSVTPHFYWFIVAFTVAFTVAFNPRVLGFTVRRSFPVLVPTLCCAAHGAREREEVCQVKPFPPTLSPASLLNLKLAIPVKTPSKWPLVKFCYLTAAGEPTFVSITLHHSDSEATSL